MSASKRLGLPLLAAGQAQKELFHNEALQLLDIIVAAAVEGPPLSTPPADPPEGNCYIVGPTPSGAWEGWENHLAAFTPGGWRFVAPVEGMQAFVRSAGFEAVFRNGGWDMGGVACSRLTIGDQQVVGARGATVQNPGGGAVIDTEARAAIGQIIGRLQEHGLIA